MQWNMQCFLFYGNSQGLFRSFYDKICHSISGRRLLPSLSFYFLVTGTNIKHMVRTSCLECWSPKLKNESSKGGSRYCPKFPWKMVVMKIKKKFEEYHQKCLIISIQKSENLWIFLKTFDFIMKSERSLKTTRAPFRAYCRFLLGVVPARSALIDFCCNFPS